MILIMIIMNAKHQSRQIEIVKRRKMRLKEKESRVNVKVGSYLKIVKLKRE